LLVVITVLALFTTNTNGVRSVITGGNDGSSGEGGSASGHVGPVRRVVPARLRTGLHEFRAALPVRP